VMEDCNEHGAELLGHAKAALIGERLSNIDVGERGKGFFSIVRLAMGKGYHEDQVRLFGNRSEPDTWLHRKLIRAGTGLAITLRDISQAKLYESKLVDMANKDALTGLPNRHWLQSFLPTALNEAKAKNLRLAIFYIDLDGFKSVNDTLGHQAGDSLLQEAATRLKSVLRPADYVIRLGGDEFAVVLSGVSGHDEVAQIAMRVSKAFHKPFVIVDRKSAVGTSIGISFFPQDGASAEELLQKADIAMYAAKAEGKGRFQFYDQQLYQRIKLREDTEQELETALEEDQFILYYQPRVNALTGELTGLEALVRWQHPERGIVSPAEFIPLVERNGLIIPIGIRIIEKACAQIALWQSQNERMVPVSINISPIQINAGGVADFIAAALARHNIHPSLLDVELTESAMVSESSHTIDEIAAITAMGIKIHVDDFGTGYSSLARLQEYKMNVLKIDRMFTSRIGIESEGDAMVKTIILMAKALNMSVIAEGVETREQLRALQSLECDEAQGYLISPPLPAEDVVSLMRRQFFLKEAIVA
jgi:diguanylate cyclase (GGDEF)-like protein